MDELHGSATKYSAAPSLGKGGGQGEFWLETVPSSSKKKVKILVKTEQFVANKRLMELIVWLTKILVHGAKQMLVVKDKMKTISPRGKISY